MYEFLEGVVERSAPTSLVLEVGGVGYALLVPLGVAFECGARARVWTHQVVREDAHTMYGFANTEQRDLFRLLLSVRGVGPAVALALLSGLSVPDLVQAVLDENTATLVRAKGVGKKTAEQILLDLRERVTRFGGEHAFVDVGRQATAPKRDERLADAIAALVSIGYKDREAAKLIEKAVETTDDLDVETLIRAVLRG
jgi:Holliday junction DNA helicase RuvA